MLNKKFRICLIGMLISVVVLLIAISATGGLLGNKEFSEYTQDDWSIAMLPLSILIISLISTSVFAITLIVPLIRTNSSVMDYITNKKFSDIDSETEFLVFNRNQFKRACCRTETQNGLWISIKEYDLTTKSWTTLEAGRHIDNADDLASILRKDYKYDTVKLYRVLNYLQ